MFLVKFSKVQQLTIFQKRAAILTKKIRTSLTADTDRFCIVLYAFVEKIGAFWTVFWGQK